MVGQRAIGLDCLLCGWKQANDIDPMRFWYSIRRKSNALSDPFPNASLQPQENLNLKGSLLGLLALGNARRGLATHDATTPPLAGILVLLKVSLLDGRDELGKLVLVLGADLGQGEDSSGLATS